MSMTISTLTHVPFLAVPAASELPWAVPQLQNNSVMVILIIVFSVVDVLACHPKGMLMHQLAWLGDTRNARTFEASAVVYPWLRPMLLIQLYLFTGLSLFCVIDNAPAVHLQAPTAETWLLLLYCQLAPIVMFLVQYGSYNWFCYLFRSKFQQIIMNRTYMASLVLLSPLATLIFIGTMAGAFSGETTLILLAVLFILSQILFIFNGIRIFFNGFGSFLIIIVYLCTLEIAPLWVLWIRFTT